MFRAGIPRVILVASSPRGRRHGCACFLRDVYDAQCSGARRGASRGDRDARVAGKVTDEGGWGVVGGGGGGGGGEGRNEWRKKRKKKKKKPKVKKKKKRPPVRCIVVVYTCVYSVSVTVRATSDGFSERDTFGALLYIFYT